MQTALPHLTDASQHQFFKTSGKAQLLAVAMRGRGKIAAETEDLR